MTVALPPSAGVIGWPVAHSKSPLIHRFWLAKLGIDGDYGRFPVHPDNLGDAIRALPKLGLRGVNVTLPHKVAVMAYLDGIDPLAERIGAVNTVTVENNRLIGHNTDAQGFMEPLRPMLIERQPRNRVATYLHLVGTGGGARAVAHGWHEYGIDMDVFGRDIDKADKLASEFGRGGIYGGFRGMDALTEEPFVYDPAFPDVKDNRGGDQRYSYVIANATTLGMIGQPSLDINLDWYPDDTIVYDIVYSPLETPLLAAARAHGMRTIDGLQMLVGQAAAAFELFFGQPAPRQHDAELRAQLTA